MQEAKRGLAKSKRRPREAILIAKFSRAPLPFQGQKRNFVRLFNELIKDEFSRYRNGIFIDAFGCSGLLSHNIKQIYPNARVIYNDYDGYCERLAHIDDRIENDGCGVFKDYKIKQAKLGNGTKSKPDYMIYKSKGGALF